MADLTLTARGSIFLLKPVSHAGSDWIAAHVPADALWCDGAVAVEHSFVLPIVDSAMSDGLEVAQ